MLGMRDYPDVNDECVLGGTSAFPLEQFESTGASLPGTMIPHGYYLDLRRLGAQWKALVNTRELLVPLLQVRDLVFQPLQRLFRQPTAKLEWYRIGCIGSRWQLGESKGISQSYLHPLRRMLDPIF